MINLIQPITVQQAYDGITHARRWASWNWWWRMVDDDDWYVSNVSIIFDCSMLYYLLFWMFTGFIIHFYIIFGTNLLTGGPALVFLPISVFRKKEYQTESKRNETFGRLIFGTKAIQKTWGVRKGSNEEGTRQGGTPTPLGSPSTLVGPWWLPWRISSSHIYPYTLKTSGSTIYREF